MKILRTSVLGLACATALVSSVGVSPAQAAQPDESADPHVALLSEYDRYWTPKPLDKQNFDTAFRGDVTPQGSKILARNDEGVEQINKAGVDEANQAADRQGRSQQWRALRDATMFTDPLQEDNDSLGPVLSKYVAEGLAQCTPANVHSCSLTHVARFLWSTGFQEVTNKSTGAAKKYFNYPRPYLADRSFADSGNPNNLRGLKKNLAIARVPSRIDVNHKRGGRALLTAGYDLMDGASGTNLTVSQAFPSGHTTAAYAYGLAMAEILPELGPEILTRASEAGNNRAVLGVHYPMDIMGGRIEGHSNVFAALTTNRLYVASLKAARTELMAYLTRRCEADGHGDTVQACIGNVGANDKNGYYNTFTDSVSTTPVVDRASALKAYRARMTYGFDKASAYGGPAPATTAPVVPTGAENLLSTAFPTLSDAQRRQVLAATEIDAGYALDSSSGGWQRINLAAAMSAKVTVGKAGHVVKIETGNIKPEVVSAPQAS